MYTKMTMVKVMLLCAVVLGICEAQSGLKTGLFAGPQGQWQSKASQLESSLNQVRTAQLNDQQRLVTMTKVFSDKLTGLDADVKSAKTVLGLLLNRSVATTRKLKEMDGMKADMSNLRGELTRIHSGLSSFLAKLDHAVSDLDKKVQNKLNAQETINGQYKTKMNELSNKVDGLEDKTAGQDAKLNSLENMVYRTNESCHEKTNDVVSEQIQGLSQTGETVRGTMNELSETVKALTTRLDNRESTVNQQQLSLRNEIEEVKREIRRNAAYPNQK